MFDGFYWLCFPTNVNWNIDPCDKSSLWMLAFAEFLRFSFSPGVLNAADYYGLDELRAACTGFADTGGGITVDTACALLASAERYIHYKCTKSLVQKVRGCYDNNIIIIITSLLYKTYNYVLICIIIA